MYSAVFRADNIPIKCTTAKLTRFLSFKIFFSIRYVGTADYFGPVCHDPADDNSGSFLDNEMIVVKQSDNSIGGLFNADDMVRIKIHLLFVHTGEKNHRAP